MDSIISQNWATILSFLGVGIAWLLTDAGFKAKIVNIEEKVNLNKKATEDNHNEFITKFTTVTIQNTRSEQDRLELHNIVEKLDNSKASKEAVDGFKQEFTLLRLEMEKRFDRLDRLVELRLFPKLPDDLGKK